jgi:hypothetical protein
MNARNFLNEELYSITSVVSYCRQKIQMNGGFEMNMCRVLQLSALKRILCTYPFRARYEYRNTNERLCQWRSKV